jgi:hypothetical protein
VNALRHNHNSSVTGEVGESRCAVGPRDGHNTGSESIAYDVTFNDTSIPSVSVSYAVQLAARFHGPT